MREDHRSYSDATFAVAKRKLEKIQACTGFEPLTIELTSQLRAGR